MPIGRAGSPAPTNVFRFPSVGADDSVGPRCISFGRAGSPAPTNVSRFLFVGADDSVGPAPSLRVVGADDERSGAKRNKYPWGIRPSLTAGPLKGERAQGLSYPYALTVSHVNGFLRPTFSKHHVILHKLFEFHLCILYTRSVRPNSRATSQIKSECHLLAVRSDTWHTSAAPVRVWERRQKIMSTSAIRSAPSGSPRVASTAWATARCSRCVTASGYRRIIPLAYPHQSCLGLLMCPAFLWAGRVARPYKYPPVPLRRGRRRAQWSEAEQVPLGYRPRPHGGAFKRRKSAGAVLPLRSHCCTCQWLFNANFLKTPCNIAQTFQILLVRIVTSSQIPVPPAR